MAENWVDERDKAILETIYYCENCNMVLEPGDTDVEQHKKELPHHKMRKVFIVRCGLCGNIVTDSHAQSAPRETSSGARTASLINILVSWEKSSPSRESRGEEGSFSCGMNKLEVRMG